MDIIGNKDFLRKDFTPGTVLILSSAKTLVSLTLNVLPKILLITIMLLFLSPEKAVPARIYLPRQSIKAVIAVPSLLFA